MIRNRYLWFWVVIFQLTVFQGVSLVGQHLSAGYEVRYFSKDPKANGETDFKGETSTLNNEKRLGFLKYFADEVSSYYDDPGLNREVVTDQEAMDFLSTMKAQPLPEVRRKMMLDRWKWLSYKPGQHETSQWERDKYLGADNIVIRDGSLCFTGPAEWKWVFPVQTWRYSMSWRIRIPDNSSHAEFSILDNSSGKTFAKIGIREHSCFIFSKNKETLAVKCEPGVWHHIKIEADMALIDGRQHYNLFVNGKLVGDYVPAYETVSQVNGFKEKASGIEVDDLYGVGYHQTTEARYPYYPQTFLDESFDVIPSIEGWQASTYYDSKWTSTNLPLAQGSERHSGEDLYLRKKITIEDFQRAYLNIETLDPGGEVWVNGKMVSVIHDRYPIRLDITKYLKPFADNHIALRVYHFYLNPREGDMAQHTYLDNNAGWFVGRVSLDLVGETFVNDAFLYTKSIETDKAVVHAKIDLEHKGTLGFKGKVQVKMGIWTRNESSEMEIVAEKALLVGPGIINLESEFSINNPALWFPESPALYKVLIEVMNEEGTIIDDYVFTTGIRTISQKDGTFHLNGKPAMLNGVQIMGFRGPIEKMITWLRCPPDWWVAKEMLMVKKMNSNMLRMHIHGWKEKAVGVNDARYCELADQMGIMLIVSPPAWIREGDWGQIDFDGYHKYMKQVQNHPSIVMWEVSNHPNTLKQHETVESDLFSEASYRAVYPFDPSRLISFTSHIGHLHYGNDAGTMDQGGDDILSLESERADIGNQDAMTSYGTKAEFSGDSIESSKAWTAPMVTRGNQDAPTGYGSEWSTLRTWPGAYRQGFLDSKARAYFNFEHQESIGQPNWNLCKGKPWYRLQSYEWIYDEGSIGRKLQHNEWRESQAWQAFSAYEATKKLRQIDYDGFSWCCLHGGANAVTYKKPVIDFLGHAKLAYHIHKTTFQPILAGSNNVDVVYGPDDTIVPMVLNLGEGRLVKLTVVIKEHFNGKEIDKKVYRNVSLPAGRTVTELGAYKPALNNEGLYFIQYIVDKQ
ncbi:MAG: glycoside hydrolase family 2 TIM barrel-domain containing protein [Bacteroidota bacterium]